ncbi:hypothetical protein M422DRAFT_253300 [Sphaerobolus stellatus SS14]|uniref:Uncharacterized protein n=1 Tax=Sphaerobolus stellatus (strain SS14) TaxID=990650 RepID=A0A0C9V8X3_SPHS4|nr:hypothetical protein M422DRAFT_253300 [Sphaerobolus stellatus SS14]
MEKSPLAKAGVKVTLPDKYNMYSMLGPDAYKYQVSFLRMRLEGKALKWFDKTVEPRKYQSTPMDLEQVVTGLYGQYIPSLARLEVSNKFDFLKQGTLSMQEVHNSKPMTMVKDDQKDWAEKCLMVEFAINSSTSATTGFALFELIYRYMSCISVTTTMTLKYRGIQQFTEQVKWNLIAAHDAIIEKCVEQTHFANRHRREPPIYKVDDLVYLSTANLRPYKVLKVDNNKSTVDLELPPELLAHRIHPTFHMKLIHSHIKNDNEHFPNREIIGHHWTNNGKIDFQVKWTLGDVTWESLHECNKLEALERYFEIHGINNPQQLPQCH